MQESKQKSLFFGVTMMIMGTLLFAIVDALIKWLAESYPATQIAFVRSTIGLCLTGIFILVTGRSHLLKTSYKYWHLVRSIFVAVLMISSFYALGHIPLVEVIAIGHAAPIIVAFLAPWLLDENVNRHHWVAIGLGFIGVLIILRPTPDHFHQAHLVMLVAALAYAGLLITARKLADKESTTALNFYVYPLTIIVAGMFIADNWVTPTLFDWSVFLLQGTTATIAIVCYIRAVKYVDAAIIAPLDYTSMIWASMIGYIFWNELPDMITFAGIVLIISSGIYILYQNRKITKLELSQSLEH